MDPAARAVPLPSRADRELVAPGVAEEKWPRRAPATRSATAPASTAARRDPRARLHRVLGRAVRDRVAVVDGRRRGEGRGRATSGRHPVQRRGPAARRRAVLREVGVVPRVQPRQARHHPRSRPSRRSRDRQAARRAQRRGRRELHPAGARAVRARLGHRARAEPRGDHAAHARVRARRSVACPRRVRADDGTAHGHGVGDGLRERAADHPGWTGRPDGRCARRARGRGRARAPRPDRASGSSSRCRSSRWRPR